MCTVFGGHKVVLCKATRWPMIWEKKRMMGDRIAIIFAFCLLNTSYGQERDSFRYNHHSYNTSINNFMISRVGTRNDKVLLLRFSEAALNEESPASLFVKSKKVLI